MADNFIEIILVSGKVEKIPYTENDSIRVDMPMLIVERGDEINAIINMAECQIVKFGG